MNLPVSRRAAIERRPHGSVKLIDGLSTESRARMLAGRHFGGIRFAIHQIDGRGTLGAPAASVQVLFDNWEPIHFGRMQCAARG
jgi:hypothetical protein